MPIAAEAIDDIIDLGRELRDDSSNKKSIKNINHSGSFRAGDIFSKHKLEEDFKPLFKNESLNKCLFVKTITDRSEVFYIRKNIVATKIILPYSNDVNEENANLYLIIGEKNFNAKLQRAFNASMTSDIKESDFLVLSILDSMPTFDPFLLKDKFEISKINIDHRYTSVSEEEFLLIKTKIIKDFEIIVQNTLDLSGEESESKNKKIYESADKLFQSFWFLEDLEVLHPLVRALGVPSDDVKNYFYSWKGLLFYYYGHSTSFDDLLLDFDRIMSFCMSDGLSDSFEIKEFLRKILKEKKSLENFFSFYESAFRDAFINKVDTKNFLKLLSNANDLFWAIGAIIGRIDIAYSYIERSKPLSLRPISPDDLRSFFRSHYK